MQESIAREGDRYQSPPWLEEALKDTQQRFESGAEHSVDRANTKRKLRK